MSVEDLTTWTLVNPDSVLSVTSTTATFTAINGSFSSEDHVIKDRGVGFYSGDFTHQVGPVNVTAVSSNNGRVCIMGLGLHTPNNGTNNYEGSVDVFWEDTTTNPTVHLSEFATTNTGGADAPTTHAAYQNAAVALSTNFWVRLDRTGTTLSLKIYSDAFTTLLQTLSFTLSQAAQAYQYVWVAAKMATGTGATATGSLQNVDLNPNAGFTLSVANLSYSLALQNQTLTGPNPAALNAAQITYSYALQNQTLNVTMPVSAVVYSLSLINQSLTNTSNFVTFPAPLSYSYSIPSAGSDFQLDISPITYAYAPSNVTLQTPLPGIICAGGTFDSLTPMPGLML